MEIIKIRKVVNGYVIIMQGNEFVVRGNERDLQEWFNVYVITKRLFSNIKETCEIDIDVRYDTTENNA